MSGSSGLLVVDAPSLRTTMVGVWPPKDMVAERYSTVRILFVVGLRCSGTSAGWLEYAPILSASHKFRTRVAIKLRASFQKRDEKLRNVMQYTLSTLRSLPQTTRSTRELSTSLPASSSHDVRPRALHVAQPFNSSCKYPIFLHAPSHFSLSP